MKRKPSPPAKDIRAPWQIAQAATCPCRGSDDYCACQNVDQSDPAQRYPSRADLEQRIRELEGTVRTLELQQQTDRQTIASLLAARPAVVSDEVVERMCRAHHETRRPAHETPAGGLTRWATWAEVCEVEDERDRRLAAMRAALALLPGGVPDREAIDVQFVENAAALAKLQAERDEAREALRPFAEASRDCDDDLVSDGCSAWESSEANCVTIGHFRAASRALGGGE